MKRKMALLAAIGLMLVSLNSAPARAGGVRVESESALEYRGLTGAVIPATIVRIIIRRIRTTDIIRTTRRRRRRMRIRRPRMPIRNLRRLMLSQRRHYSQAPLPAPSYTPAPTLQQVPPYPQPSR